MKIVIIEDEQLTSDELCDYINKADPQTNIVKKITSVKTGLDYFKSNPEYDLIFCDIQLGDGMSFEIFKQYPPKTPVIFCTAFNEYSFEAFSVNGIDYILKPFDFNMVCNSLKKVEQFKGSLKNDYTRIERLYSKIILNHKNILVHSRGRIIPIKLADISLFFIDYEIVKLYTIEQQEFVVNNSLEELEKIGESLFFRVNRQFLVNKHAIGEALSYEGRKLLLTFNIPFPHPVVVSKSRSTSFIKWLKDDF